MDLPEMQSGLGELAARDLGRAIEDEDKIAQAVGSMRRRLAKLEELNTSVADYRSTLTGQEDRMLSAGWLEQRIHSGHTCPVCTAVHAEGNPRLLELRSLAREFGTVTASRKARGPHRRGYSLSRPPGKTF